MICRVTTGVSNFRELVRRTSVVFTYSGYQIATRHHKEYGEVFRPLIRIKRKYERERGGNKWRVKLRRTGSSNILGLHVFKVSNCYSSSQGKWQSTLAIDKNTAVLRK